MVCDLIREVLEIHEDIQWRKVVQEREFTFCTETALSHGEVWSV